MGIKRYVNVVTSNLEQDGEQIFRCLVQLKKEQSFYFHEVMAKFLAFNLALFLGENRSIP